MLKYKLVNPDYKTKNPFVMIYKMAGKVNTILFAKQVNAYTQNQMLEQLENLAESFNFYVVPRECLTWNKIKKIKQTSPTSRVKIGLKCYFAIKKHELTNLEKAKLIDYLNAHNIPYTT